MLTHLHIRDFAIVTELELEFSPGFTVLTGETGAGKSILIGALGLALGDRADSDNIRHGADKSDISAAFSLVALPDAVRWLEQNELGVGDDECHIRRVITRAGKSKSYVNGTPVPLQQLRALGDILVDIHGQHEHQSLLKKEHQLRLLDDFADHKALLDAVRRNYSHMRATQKALTALKDDLQIGAQHKDLLRYQAQELESLALTKDGLLEIEQEHKRLLNASELISACEFAVLRLTEDEESVSSQIARAQAALNKQRQFDESLGPAIDLINNAFMYLNEAASELRHYRDNLGLDPIRLRTVEERIEAIDKIARKHRVPAEKLVDLRLELQEKLSRLEGAEAEIERLEEELEQARQLYGTAARNLTESRNAAARRLADKVSANMRELGMPNGVFEIEVTPFDTERISANGLDQVEFMVTTNEAVPPKPLTKIASGGELSRISLAIQVVTARHSGTPVQVFDEVDVGIGGRVAEIVGQELRKLGKSRQVICITHLPQVAALGHHHFQVHKSSNRRSVTTTISELSREQRQEEIARMLGGITVSDTTREHAQEMIARAEECV